MPIVITALGILATVYFYFMRAGGAARAATDVINSAGDVRAAARRFGFRRRANVHPVDSVEDGKIAIAALAAAFVEMDDMPTARHWTRMAEELRFELSIPQGTATELAIFGRWLVGQCGTPQAAVSRLARKLAKLDGTTAAKPLLTVINNTLVAEQSDLNERQKDALHDVSVALRIR